MVQTFGHEPNPAKRLRKQQGNLIRKAREARGMTVPELAQAVGVSPGAISHWETGRYTPRQQHQVEIARAVNMPWSFLFGLDGAA